MIIQSPKVSIHNSKYIDNRIIGKARGLYQSAAINMVTDSYNFKRRIFDYDISISIRTNRISGIRYGFIDISYNVIKEILDIPVNIINSYYEESTPFTWYDSYSNKWLFNNNGVFWKLLTPNDNDITFKTLEDNHKYPANKYHIKDGNLLTYNGLRIGDFENVSIIRHFKLDFEQSSTNNNYTTPFGKYYLLNNQKYDGEELDLIINGSSVKNRDTILAAYIISEDVILYLGVNIVNNSTFANIWDAQYGYRLVRHTISSDNYELIYSSPNAQMTRVEFNSKGNRLLFGDTYSSLQEWEITDDDQVIIHDLEYIRDNHTSNTSDSSTWADVFLSYDDNDEIISLIFEYYSYAQSSYYSECTYSTTCAYDQLDGHYFGEKVDKWKVIYKDNIILEEEGVYTYSHDLIYSWTITVSEQGTRNDLYIYYINVKLGIMMFDRGSETSEAHWEYDYPSNSGDGIYSTRSWTRSDIKIINLNSGQESSLNLRNSNSGTDITEAGTFTPGNPTVGGGAYVFLPEPLYFDSLAIKNKLLFEISNKGYTFDGDSLFDDPITLYFPDVNNIGHHVRYFENTTFKSLHKDSDFDYYMMPSDHHTGFKLIKL
jgi:hypothetical protein